MELFKPTKTSYLKLPSVLLLLLLFSTAILTAQPPMHPRPGMKMDVFKKLNLDDETSNKITAIQNKHIKEATLLKLEMEKIDIALKEMFIKDEINKSKIDELCEKKGESFGKLFKLSFTKDLEIKKLLNEEQWQIYFTHMMREKRKGERGDGHKGQNKGQNKGPNPKGPKKN